MWRSLCFAIVVALVGCDDRMTCDAPLADHCRRYPEQSACQGDLAGAIAAACARPHYPFWFPPRLERCGPTDRLTEAVGDGGRSTYFVHATGRAVAVVEINDDGDFCSAGPEHLDDVECEPGTNACP